MYKHFCRVEAEESTDASLCVGAEDHCVRPKEEESARSFEVAGWQVSMGMLKSPMMIEGMSAERKCRSQVLKWSRKIVAGPGGR